MPAKKIELKNLPHGNIVGWKVSEPINAAQFQRLYKRLHKWGWQVYDAHEVICAHSTICPTCGASHRITIYLWQGKHQPLDPVFTVCLDCFTAVQEIPIYESDRSCS
jgi:hypothetical protein